MRRKYIEVSAGLLDIISDRERGSLMGYGPPIERACAGACENDPDQNTNKAECQNQIVSCNLDPLGRTKFTTNPLGHDVREKAEWHRDSTWP